MDPVGNLGQRGVGFALRAGADDRDFVARIPFDLPGIDERSGLDAHVSERLRNGDVGLHRSSLDGHTSTTVFASDDDLLNASQHGGKRADDESARAVANDLVQVVLDRLFRLLATGKGCIGGVDHERQYVLRPERLDLFRLLFRLRAGIVIKLEVAGMHHDAARRVDDDSERAGERVRHAEELDLEGAKLKHRLCRDHAHVEWRLIAMLLLTLLDKRTGEIGGKHRRVANAAHHVWNSANVIKVTVGNDQAENRLLASLEVVEVGHDVVDAGHLALGKLQAHVDQNGIIVVLDERAIAANFFVAAENGNTEPAVAGIGLGIHVICPFYVYRGQGSFYLT